MKYKDVAYLFGRARDPSKGKPVTSNTRLFMLDGGKYALRYHDTDIITWYLDGRILLCNGGWPTLSTHRNINRFTPQSIRVYAKDNKTEVNLKRSYMNAESVWIQTKHITKPAYDTPKNFKAMSVTKQMYGTRVTYFMLEPLDNGGKEYRLDNAMVVIL
jgi:hypothetical protein|tara:strand:- start:1245 stop:1721 length:477 start_codon:yes stop_codon:yes gene_type:complete